MSRADLRVNVLARIRCKPNQFGWLLNSLGISCALSSFSQKLMYSLLRMLMANIMATKDARGRRYTPIRTGHTTDFDSKLFMFLASVELS